MGPSLNQNQETTANNPEAYQVQTAHQRVARRVRATQKVEVILEVIETSPALIKCKKRRLPYDTRIHQEVHSSSMIR